MNRIMTYSLWEIVWMALWNIHSFHLFQFLNSRRPTCDQQLGALSIRGKSHSRIDVFGVWYNREIIRDWVIIRVDRKYLHVLWWLMWMNVLCCGCVQEKYHRCVFTRRVLRTELLKYLVHKYNHWVYFSEYVSIGFFHQILTSCFCDRWVSYCGIMSSFVNLHFLKLSGKKLE